MEVCQEIRISKYAGSPIADIVCVSGDAVWVIELKTSLNLDVIRQAESWKVDYRSIAVTHPKSKYTKENNQWWYQQINRHMGLGTLIVNPTNYGNRVVEYKVPTLYHNPIHSQKFIEICRSGKTDGFSEAGSQNGKYWTPYKETMIAVRKFVEQNPGCGVGDIVRVLGKLHYANDHSARTNLAKNLNELEQSWCEVRRKGTYDTFFVREDA